MNPDNGEAERELSAQQALAVDLIAAGRSLTEAAALVGLTRQTLSGWNQTPRFRAALNMRCEELWSASADQLRALLLAAVATLGAALNGPDGVKAALEHFRLTRAHSHSCGCSCGIPQG
jgi:hypothetical protein